MARGRRADEEEVMKYGFLRYTSYLVLVFGFLYISWHMGRSFENDGGADEGVTITTCRDSGYSIDCSSVEVGLGDFMHVYDTMTDELDMPAPGGAEPRLEFTKR
jgi:hypothetical protein